WQWGKWGDMVELMAVTEVMGATALVVVMVEMGAMVAKEEKEGAVDLMAVEMGTMVLALAQCDK
ncbi:hypothetical protein AAY77_15540, partial [Providencia rettgeri]